MDKRWTTVFKALGNVNRIKIITMLHKGASLNVSQIARELGISVKSTSKHLILLQNLDLLESTGKQGHVYYNFSRTPPKDLKQATRLFVR